MTYRKKLIEVALPLEAINKASARKTRLSQSQMEIAVRCHGLSGKPPLSVADLSQTRETSINSLLQHNQQMLKVVRSSRVKQELETITIETAHDLLKNSGR